jgi:hypothetical protein
MGAQPPAVEAAAAKGAGLGVVGGVGGVWVDGYYKENSQEESGRNSAKQP